MRQPMRLLLPSLGNYYRKTSLCTFSDDSLHVQVLTNSQVLEVSNMSMTLAIVTGRATALISPCTPQRPRACARSLSH
jgi:hypothetical protein